MLFCGQQEARKILRITEPNQTRATLDSIQGGSGTEPEPETGTVRTIFPETESGTGTAGTVFQEPKPDRPFL